METKQVICIRKDLKMRRGKEAAQAAHASMAVFFDKITERGTDSITISNLDKEMMDWVNGAFTKVCVSVQDEKQLFEIYRKAKDAKLPVSMITDAGKTEFGGKPTKTCIAIGPAEASKIDNITGDLKLL